uniref:Uncharacterized protein n=1 Tax=Arundo donax TaxID=35708 RepID=A0A0A9F196_ARUDO
MSLHIHSAHYIGFSCESEQITRFCCTEVSDGIKLSIDRGCV